uniref:Uncharacterized protein n=1 Tax=Spermophilus dauricus TaxID=99837 RepID=A0A8C9QUU0_SPEDA
IAAAEVVDTQWMPRVQKTEKDTDEEVLWVWPFPFMTATLSNLLLRKCHPVGEDKLFYPFVFGQHRRTWFYITIEVHSIKKKNIAQM